MSFPERELAWAHRFQGWLGAAVICGVIALAWSGYRATTEWQGSSARLVERRARDLADLLTTALTRDMQGAQATVLDASAVATPSFEPPSDVTEVVATAFARYPYPELFFGWNVTPPTSAVFLTRADRRPPWLAVNDAQGYYPVEPTTNEELERLLRGRIAQDAAAQRRYSAFDTVVGGMPYQVIARLAYTEDTREHLANVFGFMVNVTWVREHYFSALAQQAARIGESGVGLDYMITDERGVRVAGTNGPGRHEPGVTRDFPAIFLDPSRIALDPPADLHRPSWTIHVMAASDRTLELAAQGARRTLLALAAAALLAGLGLAVAIRAAHASARVATMRSDFVSAVTHELKTPLSTIRTIADTLVRGRLGTAEQVRTYAELLAQEERRLARLIDNLLAYARVTDVTEVYSFESLSPHDVAAEAMARFKHQLMDGSVEFRLDVDPALPRIRADRTALVLAFDNLIDNAIRYSGATTRATLTARADGRVVEFVVSDRGVGIPPDELERVQRRFSRGRSATGQGSGLGLAIVRRIASDHGGALQLESTVGVGTTVRLAIPIAVA